MPMNEKVFAELDYSDCTLKCGLKTVLPALDGPSSCVLLDLGLVTQGGKACVVHTISIGSYRCPDSSPSIMGQILIGDFSLSLRKARSFSMVAEPACLGTTESIGRVLRLRGLLNLPSKSRTDTRLCTSCHSSQSSRLARPLLRRSSLSIVSMCGCDDDGPAKGSSRDMRTLTRVNCEEAL
ncbi:hypothetical protein CC79DRAFT_166254 [Sarocladium strictum]